MNDITSTVNDYLAAWNEGDAARRRALVGQAFAEDARYLDPHFEGAGTDGIAEMIGGVQGQFPGHRFELADGPDAHHDRVRFTWHLQGPDGPVAIGTDFATVAEDGRLRDVTGFLALP
ncbi:MAG: nuclear transport factor 2 family protein [Solirubrobacteraceae bacterium]